MDAGWLINISETMIMFFFCQDAVGVIFSFLRLFFMNTYWLILCSFLCACRITFGFFFYVCVCAVCFSGAKMMVFI